MKDRFLVLSAAAFLIGACGPRAGDNCPPVPQTGQVCTSAGAVCVYQQPMPNACAPGVETQCVNGRWAMHKATIPAYCDASADAPSDAPSDAPKDVASDG